MNRVSQFSRLQLGIICSVLVAIPFLLVTFPPITDLPQQTGQIRLFWEALGESPSSPYQIRWLAPNNLSYAVLGASVYLFGYENGGRIAMMLIAVAWCVAIHLLAARRNRPVEAAVLASVFVFNHVIYWGFYSFALGFPLFVWCYFVTLEDSHSDFTWKTALKWTILIFLLYCAHIFWFWVAVFWLVIVSLRGVPVQVTVRRCLTFLPALVMFVVWFMHSSPGPYSSPMRWNSSPVERIGLAIVNREFLGGIVSPPIEFIVLFLTATWIVVALFSNRKTIASKTDFSLIFLAMMFFVGWFALPDWYDISIRMWTRWLPPMAIFLLLAAPPIVLSEAWKQRIALIVLTSFIATTGFVWVQFERIELSGLRESLDLLPPRSRVIGLDYLKASPRIAVHPYMQLFSYAYLLKDAKLNFSFLDLGRSLVANKELRLHEWTPMLEWYAERATQSDLRHFDYAIIGGKDQVHLVMAQSGILSPVSRQGFWRLYRVVDPLPRKSP